MKYFLANLGIHTLFLILLIIILVVTFNRNKKHKVKHTLTYFIPVIVSVLIILDLVKLTAPRYLDLSSIISQNYYSYTGVIDEIGRFNNYVVIDGVTYYINPLRELPQPGTQVKVKYSSHSNYAIEIAAVEVSTETGM